MSIMMGNWLQVLLVIVIGLGVIQFRVSSATGNSSTPGNDDEDEDEDEDDLVEKKLTIAWIEKPPYTTSPPNGSLDNEAHGMIRDTILRYIYECGHHPKVNYDVKTLRVDSEFGMIELLRQNKVHAAAPVFELRNRRYSEFPFVQLVDYPGTDFITTENETNGLAVVLDAVLKSWPLCAVTLILTAIAGIIVWALVGFNCICLMKICIPI